MFRKSQGDDDASPVERTAVVARTPGPDRMAPGLAVPTAGNGPRPLTRDQIRSMLENAQRLRALREQERRDRPPRAAGNPPRR